MPSPDQHRHSRTAAVLAWLILATLACTVSASGPRVPSQSASASPDALDSFRQKWLGLPEALTNGQFTLSFTEEEVASVVDQAVAGSASEGEDALPLQDLHLVLDQNVLLYAETGGPFFKATGLVTLTPAISEDGGLVMNVADSEFGRVSLDEPLLDRLASSLADALVAPTEGLPVGILLTGTSVVDRQLILTGTIVE